jgi:uncharacterized phage protein (TIGR02220 family)
VLPLVHPEETHEEETSIKTPLPPEGAVVQRQGTGEAQEPTLAAAFEVIEHLNAKTGASFNAESFARFLQTRVRRWGYSVDELKKVIDLKVAEWKGTDLERHLTPSVLFKSRARMAEYLQHTAQRKRASAQATQGSRQACHRQFTREELQLPKVSSRDRQAAVGHLKSLKLALRAA